MGKSNVRTFTTTSYFKKIPCKRFKSERKRRTCHTYSRFNTHTHLQAPAKMRLRSKKYHKNITARGKVQNKKKDEGGVTVGPVILAFFFFVIIGSSLLQTLRAVQSGPPGGR